MPPPILFAGLSMHKPMKLLLTTAILSIAIVIAAGQRLHAQARDRSTLSGTVVDETGAVLRGVAIVLTNSETTARRRLTTDSRNVIGGPGAFTADLALHKRFTLPWGENHRLE